MPEDWSFEAAHVKLSGWMAPFSTMFTAPTWQRVLVLLIGAVLSPSRRTVAAALRVTGLDQDPHFTNYHPCSEPLPLVQPTGGTMHVPPVGLHLRSKWACHHWPWTTHWSDGGCQDRCTGDLS